VINTKLLHTGGIVYSTVSAIRTVFSLNAAEKMIEEFKTATQKARKSAVGFTVWVGLANGGMMASFIVSYIALTLYGAFKLYTQVRVEGCDPGNVIPTNAACGITGRNVFGALMGISFGGMGLAQIGAAIEAFIGSRSACYPAILAIDRKSGQDEETPFLNESPEDPEGANASKEIPLPKYVIDSSSDEGKKPSSVDGEIVFNDVSFEYPTRPDAKVFDHMSLTIKAGQTVALVGPSGGGKSTTVSLLERFYDPTSGSILLDGVDLKDLNVAWLREQIGLVSQEPVLFARSIRENIAYGLPGATDEQIIAVAKSANAHDFISKFPSGYDTEVGDKGAQLSGGQKQRIAIARILLKNPKILLLDEATSALDTESEYLVQQALDDVLVSGNRTTVIIAHRLSTIRNADVIAVVKEGRIVEQGSHEELIHRPGSEYAQLVEAQSSKKPSKASVISSSLKSTFSRVSSEDGAEIDSPQIQFHDVHFHYPSRPENEIFRGLNLSIRNGETLAIVGPSGGGKSTIIQMIERFYDPLSGSVEYEGTNLKDLNVQSLREHLGLVSQEPSLFNRSIAENIKFGMPAATQSEIEDAARKANAHDFIMSFPEGYDTEVGENATQVSGGQKQRIAIARALIKKPKILLFDEATSALDSQSEAVVQQAINSLMESKNQTVVVIAHRLSTIKNADRIAVVADGVIKEIGSHDYLMSIPDGQYKRLVEYNAIGGDKTKIVKKKAVTNDDDDDATDTESNVDKDGELDKEIAKEVSNRAKVLGRNDWGLFFIGGIGAILAGLVFPGWGVVFAFMIELLYYPVFECTENGTGYIAPDGRNFDTCQDYWDAEADYLREFSIKITYAWVGIIASTLIGNTMLFYGFGAATEKMNKRVRDAIFIALMKQDIGYFDTNSVGTLSTKLEEDAAMMHSFSGEPIRQLTMMVASVLVGLFISFWYMWPFALLTLAILPFMGFGAYMEMKMYMGEDDAEDEKVELEGNSGGIVVETLMSMRTVAALSIERMRSDEYVRAINIESPNSLKSNLLKGAASGLGVFIQFWGIGLMFWWGGFLMDKYPGTYSYRGYLISLNSLLFSLSGLSVAIMGATDSAKAKLAANRIFKLIDRESPIDSLSEEGKKIV
jgi:ATP-binding cassette subfamily B (MDR/TAP) protein 1